MSLPRTPSQTVGPFYSIGLCRRRDDELVPKLTPGAVIVRGTLFDGAGAPVADGVVELWSATSRSWGRCGTDQHGSFSFVVAKPDAGHREAPRFDVFVFARGLLRHQLTRLYFPDEQAANAADAVLEGLAEADRATLVAAPEDGDLRFDIHLQGDRQTVFFAH